MKILIVCLGNICRSPIMEGVLKSKVREAGLDWTVHSAGTNRWHKGGPADERAVKISRRKGIDISGHVARRFREEDFKNYDRIYSLADDVLEEIREFSSDAKQMEIVENFPVPDPWYGGEADFENCYQIVDEICRRIIARAK